MYVQNHTYISHHVDINECSDGKHDCSTIQTCMNTDGSFTCGCSSGYVRDGATCIGMYKLLVLFWYM